MADSTISQQKLDAQTFQRLHPRAYLERFLSEGIRPDGRLDDVWRTLNVNAGSITTAEGSALVRLGNTTVVCGVKAEIAEPELDRPEHGYIVPNVDISAICSPKFKNGPPGEESQALSERIHEILVSSNFLSPTTLCIEPGKSVWVLYIDTTCINYDGNAFDATLLAVIAALQNTTLPRATYYPERSSTLCSRTLRHPLSLDSSKMPIPFSFGTFSSSSSKSSMTLSSTYILSDPTSFEEPLLQSTLSIILFPSGRIANISQTGSIVLGDGTGAGIDATTLCLKRAKERMAIVVPLLEAQLKKQT